MSINDLFGEGRQRVAEDRYGYLHPLSQRLSADKDGVERISICNSCVHFKDGACPAFPDGVPESILIDGADHRSVLPGQEGQTVHVLQRRKEDQFEEWLDAYIFESPVE